MFDWLPSWTPVGGWNHTWTEKEKIQCSRLYFFFHNRKHYSAKSASMMAQMVIYKDKYHGLYYSEEQEQELKKALQTIHSVKA
jgi:hypothetical protein